MQLFPLQPVGTPIEDMDFDADRQVVWGVDADNAHIYEICVR